MSAALLTAAAFATGVFVGVVVSGTTKAAADYRAEQSGAGRDDLVRQWRDGYEHGWTTGRLQLVDEQRAQRHHPTAHPLGEVIRIEHRRKDELDDLWGED